MVSLQGFLWLIGLSFGAATSDCSGSSCTPRTSLLQVKSKAHKESVILGMQSKTTARLAEYSKFTDELVAKYGQVQPVSEEKADESAADANELEAVRTVLQFIGDIYNSLLQYHEGDVTLAEQCSKSAILAKCEEDHLNASSRQALTEVYTTVQGHAEAHKGCRNMAHTCYANLQVSCPDYLAYRMDTGKYSSPPNEAKLPSCVLTTPNTEEAAGKGEAGAFSDVSIQTSHEGQLEVFEECLRQTKAWLDPLYGRYSACTPAANTCGEFQDDCTDKQDDFENAHCEWSIMEGLKCEGVNDCGTTDTATCKSKCEQIAIRERSRLADNETGQRLVCLLHVIFGTPDDVDSDTTGWAPRPSAKDRPAALARCKNPSEYSMPDWSITCEPGEWEAPDVCDKDIQTTCSPGFMDKWYYPAGLQAPCEDCTFQQQAEGNHVDTCETTCER